MNGIAPPWCATIRQWAHERREIKRVWIFGSRARGTHRSESDLDIGVELFGEESERLAVWIGEKSSWVLSLQSLIEIAVDLELADPILTPDRVWPAVMKDGVQVFDRGQAAG